MRKRDDEIIKSLFLILSNSHFLKTRGAFYFVRRTSPCTLHWKPFVHSSPRSRSAATEAARSSRSSAHVRRISCSRRTSHAGRRICTRRRAHTRRGRNSRRRTHAGRRPSAPWRSHPRRRTRMVIAVPVQYSQHPTVTHQRLMIFLIRIKIITGQRCFRLIQPGRRHITHPQYSRIGIACAKERRSAKENRKRQLHFSIHLEPSFFQALPRKVSCENIIDAPRRFFKS